MDILRKLDRGAQIITLVTFYNDKRATIYEILKPEKT